MEPRFIITSRPTAIEEGWLERESFEDAELQPMELPDVYEFIDHWHAAVKEGVQDNEEKTELDSLSESIKDVVKRSRSIRNLATNPLLCAVLCALHRDRHRQLPSDRIELYEACCHMLLVRGMEQHLLVETKDYPTLSYRQKELLLANFAYWMLINGWSTVTVNSADEHFSHKLKNMGDIAKDVTGSAVLRFFVDRSNVIREPVLGQVDFTHRTFQEFLAAKAAADSGDIGLLSKKADDDQWREVIILAAGLATKKNREELIQSLIQRGDDEETHRHQLHLLAVACLETSVELDPVVRKEVETRLTKLVPPKNITEAKEIASAGDLAVSHLKYNRQFNNKEAAASVRALSLIGSDSAFEALKTYKKEFRWTVFKELFKAADSFEREQYFQKVLAHIQTHILKLDKMSSLEGFQYLTQLERLEIGDCSMVEDLSPLANLNNLETLHLAYCSRISDLNPLTNLTNLHSLDLIILSSISELGPLVNLDKLTSLSLFGCSSVSDLSPLANLSNLTSLHLSGFRSVKDLSPLANLSNLTSLHLSGFGSVEDLGPLANLSNLTSHSITFCPQVEDLSPLGNLTKLSRLDLKGCKNVRDLNPLVGLQNLKEIRLDSGLEVPIELRNRVEIVRWPLHFPSEYYIPFL